MKWSPAFTWPLTLATYAALGGLGWLLSRRRRPAPPSQPPLAGRPVVHEITDAPERPAYDQAWAVGTSDDSEGGEST